MITTQTNDYGEAWRALVEDTIPDLNDPGTILLLALWLVIGIGYHVFVADRRR